MSHKQRHRAPKLMPLEKRLMLDASLPIIAGQVLWLDAADATTIRDADGDNAASGTGGANNGFSGSVATWVDKSSSGFNVANTTVVQQPSYTLGALNGRNVVSFDGSTDRLINTTAVIAGNDYTAFVVFNRTTAAGRDAVFELGGGGSRNGLFVNDSGGRLGFYANAGFHNSTNVYTPGTYEVVTMIHDVTAINMWRNNSSEVNSVGTARATTTGIYIADDSTTGDQLQGNIAEFIVYDRDLSADERRDVQNYLASKWGLTLAGNATPVLGVNTGATVSQSDPVIITSAMLASTDADNSESILRYTITDLADYGTLTNTNTSQVYALGEFFTQADIDAGYIQYTHDGTANFSDSFSFTVSDLYASTAGATFNLTITPDNQAPVLQGWTLVSAEDFEGGATGWSINTTEANYPYLTRFLGRHSNEGGAQNVFKTYTLSGSQDFTILSFDFYRLDSWDTEQFRIFIDDVLVFNQTFTPAYTVIPDGSLGSVSWTVQEVTGSAPNFVYGTWGDQIMRFTVRIDNNAAGDIKLGFSSTTNQATNDESWGVDNINVYEVRDGGIPGPLHIVEGMPNGTALGTVTARDPDVGDTLTYSVTGGTGSGIFSIDAATGVITLTNTAAVDYETTTSYTLTVRVTDNGAPSYFDEETITINVVDRPENTAPTINALGPVNVSEAATNGTVVGTMTGNDAEGNTITWSITGGNTDNIFAINSTTGAIRVNNNTNLNFEWDASYTLTIQAQDNGWGNMASTRNVTINVTDVNEAPIFNIPQSFLNENPYLRYNATTGNFYRYVGTTANYATASADAAASLLNGVAGHIATITSAAENAYVRSLGSGNLWLSASDATVEGEWRWIGGGAEAGEMFWLGGAAGSAQGGYYTNWAGTQPDNAANEDYIEMQGGGLWNDVNPTGGRRYVIEWEGAAVMAALGNGPYSLAENPTMNQSVGFVHARDPDAGDTLTYSVTGGTGAAHFAIDSATGEIRVTNPSAINYEAVTSFTLDVRVQDAGGLFSTQTVTIDITDVNEAPVLAAHAPVTIAENIALNTVIADMDATDVDAGQTLTYSITGGNALGIFAINASNGQIRIANLNNLNYETGSVYNLTIRVTDNGAGTLFDTEVITINITDVNEAPSFDPVQRLLNNDPGLRYNSTTGNFYRYINTTATYANATIAANATLLNGVAGYVAAVGSAAENAYITSLISATSWLGGNDIDVEGEWRWAGGENSGDMFWLGNGSGSAQNGLYSNWNGAEPNNSSGNEDALEIRTNGLWNDINAGSSRSYVIEWDGTAVLASLQNGPYVFGENASIGFSPGSATAGDPDIGDVLTYSITGGSGTGVFQIDGSTGQITLINGVNYEVQNSYTLDLRVEDSAGLFDTVTITLTVTDENDAPSLLTLTGDYIVENSPIDTLIGTLSTTDEDPLDTHTYSLVTNPGGKFVIANGNEIRTLGDIDYEQNQSFSVVIRTNDGNGGVLDRTFLITVGDVMDTFTPPPATGGSGGSDIFIPTEEREPESTGDLLRSAFGAEEGQSSAFYGQGFRQYLRENVTFEVRNILNGMRLSEAGAYGDVLFNQPEEVLFGSSPQQEARTQKFTNIREALIFLQQMADSQTDGDDEGRDAGDQTDSPSRTLPQSAIDRQFVDVMTYHEDRAARLREALLAG